MESSGAGVGAKALARARAAACRTYAQPWRAQGEAVAYLLDDSSVKKPWALKRAGLVLPTTQKALVVF